MKHEMTFHDVANIFPLMSAEGFAALVGDIKQHGQRVPICTHDGQIVDGRNRYKACLQLGVEPRFQEWDGEGSLVAYVVSLNKQRRHLTSSQLAVVGLDVEIELAKEAKAKERARKANGSTFQIIEKSEIHAAEQAAKLVGTNRQYISDAKKLAAKSPEMLEQVRQGSINLPNAIQHVAAVTSYPELAAPGIPQKDAITIAKNLDALPEDERTEARSRIISNDTNTKAVLAGKPPFPKPLARSNAKPTTSGWLATLVKLRQLFGSIRDHGGWAHVVAEWEVEEQNGLLLELEELREELDTQIILMRGANQ